MFWCRRLTISSQYNCVQIIIYPLKNGLFRVKFYKKENVSFEFPLNHELMYHALDWVYFPLAKLNSCCERTITHVRENFFNQRI